MEQIELYNGIYSAHVLENCPISQNIHMSGSPGDSSIGWRNQDCCDVMEGLCPTGG